MTQVLQHYRALVAASELRADPEQEAAAERLDRLAQELEAVPKKGSILWRALGRAPDPPRGVYLWGGVGRGKSMLMDLFFESVAIRRKRRVHFHEFMLEVHERLNVERQKETADPVIAVADAMADDIRLLAFDEMVVNNPADAMILSRLFTELMRHGLTVVATSNRPPQDLYKDGLNRDLFLPFIRLIGEQMDVIALNGPVDYRLDRLGRIDTWLVPNGPEATAQLSAAFFRLTDYPPEDRAHVPACELPVQGDRELHVPKCLKGVAVFSFKRLCGERARRARLSRDRAALPHRDPRRHPQARARQPQRGRALRHADRRALRASRQAPRRRRRRARASLREGRRQLRIPAHRQPARGDAIGSVSRRGAWRERTMTRAALRAIAILLCLAATPALAGPPYDTDDPEPTDLGHWEVYAFTAGSRAQGSVDGAAGLDLNYGAFKGVQLTATLPIGFATSEPAHAGDVELGVKYRFFEDQAAGLSIAAFPRVILPTGGRFGSSKAAVLLPVWLQKDFHGWSLFGGGGYTINPGAGNRNFWRGGIALTHDVSRRLSLGVEATHQGRNARDSRALTTLGVGGSYRLHGPFSILFSAGPGFERGGPVQTHAYAALELNF